MAQGALKKNATPNPGKAGRTSHGTKNKAGSINKPKKAKKASTDKIHKKFTSGMVARTEAMLGEKAGHLELIGKGRKKGADKATDDKKKKLGQGGSRKFG
ncbi:hypothetical protein V8F20_000874 [Naviculisporaceae sp. PSN 640]